MWSFDSNGSAEFSNITASLEGLVARSPLIVYGQLIRQLPYTIEGTVLYIKSGGLVGSPQYDRVKLEYIWVPGTFSGSGILGDSFVAFLSGNQIQYSNFLGESAWEVNLDGLWVACDSEVTSIAAGPDGSAHAVELDEPMTQDELWSVVSASDLPALDLWWHHEQTE